MYLCVKTLLSIYLLNHQSIYLSNLSLLLFIYLFSLPILWMIHPCFFVACLQQLQLCVNFILLNFWNLDRVTELRAWYPNICSTVSPLPSQEVFIFIQTACSILLKCFKKLRDHDLVARKSPKSITKRPS